MRKPEIIIQSHRGAGRLGPENTLESFELAWKIGTIPEADVSTTKDGVLVAFHDRNFARLVKDVPEEIRDIGVGDLPWEEVRKLDVGAYMGEEFTGQHIPSLDSVFQAMSGRPERLLYLDFKNIPLETLVGLARKHRVSQQTIFASTRYELIRNWKKLAPESRTLLWMGEKEPRLEARMVELRAAGFADITQLQIHVYLSEEGSGDMFSPSSEFLRRVGEEVIPRGILFQALPWGTDRLDVYLALMELGVQSFATDDPLVVFEAYGIAP